jgi:hypothetical protein
MEVTGRKVISEKANDTQRQEKRTSETQYRRSHSEQQIYNEGA